MTVFEDLLEGPLLKASTSCSGIVSSGAAFSVDARRRTHAVSKPQAEKQSYLFGEGPRLETIFEAWTTIDFRA